MISGGIIIWSGAIVNIPSGFVLCNGANGTPDLRDKFIAGAGSTYAVGANGGNVNHTHTFTGDGHAHTINPGGAIQIGANYDSNTASQVAAGTTDAENGLPPYYALAYIMKT